MTTHPVADQNQPDDTTGNPSETAPALSIVSDLQPAAPAADSQVMRESLCPATLLLDHNVRLTTSADKTLVESIREHGVLQPIIAVRTSDGGVRVRYGHRRTLAAVEAGLTTVPVDVIGDEDDDQVDRILTQWAENQVRTGLSTSDQVSAVAQLAAFGLTPAQIAKKTRTKRADVDQAIAVQASELARKATARFDFLDLTQAAVVADFEAEPETVKALIAAAKDGEFDHVAQRADDDRATARAVEALTAELTANNVRIIDRPTYGERNAPERLTSLADKGKPLTDDGHAKCPGHAAFIAANYRSATVVYVCTDPKGNGHTDRYGSASTSRAAGPLSEQEKAERATVRDNNAAWRSAEAVRRTWLAEYATLKGATKEATAFLATAVLHGDHALRKGLENRHRYARELLKMSHGYASGGDPLAQTMATATENRVTQLAVVAVLAAYEDATGVHSWRNPDDATGRYLTYLAACGYTLSTVERLAIPKPKPVKAKTSRARKTTTKTASSPTQPSEALTAGADTTEIADGPLSATEGEDYTDADDLGDEGNEDNPQD